MRNIVTIALFLFCSLATVAQEDRTLNSSVESVSIEPDNVSADNGREYLNGIVPIGSFDKSLPAPDTLHLPPLDSYGRVRSYHSWRLPYLNGSIWGWDVHKGLNASIGVSAFTSFGKNSFNGWGQDIALLYATPINDKLSVAVGGYFNNLSTNRGAIRSAGITGVLNYRFNEHWEAFIYGQKGLYDNASNVFCNPYYHYGFGYPPLYGTGILGDRIGAGVRWSPSESMSIQVQMEWNNEPRHFHDRIQDHWQMPERK